MADRLAVSGQRILARGFVEMRREIHRMLVSPKWGEAVAAMAKEYEGDFEFDEVRKFADDYRRLRIGAPEFSNIGQTFATSMDRVSYLVWLPIELCFWTGLSVHADACARAQLGGSPLNYNHDGTPEFIEIARKIHKIGATAPEGQEFGEYVWGMGISQLKSILRMEHQTDDGGDKYRRAGLEAVLAAMITAAYAAFEALAGDLWIAALNRHEVLARNYMEKHRDKKIDFASLVGRSFDLTKVMGTVLTENRYVQFMSFNDVRNAYQTAFRGDLDHVFAESRDIIETEKVRHLIAHRGGVVDSKFHAEMQDYSDYKDIPVNTQIQFSGPLARRHISACSKMGSALFSAVDSWSPQ